MRLSKIILILILITLVGFSLRFINVWQNPPALYGDEVTLVYDAYSILHTGRDQLGNFLPLTFQLGDNRPAGYIYATLPFVYLFGPTTLAARAVSVLSGTGLIVLIFFLAKKLLDERTALASAFLLAISPWNLSISRGGFEASFALFLYVGGIVFWLYFPYKKWLLIPAILFLGLTSHTYPVYKLLAPLTVLILAWFTRVDLLRMSRWLLVLAGLIYLSFVGLNIEQALFAHSESRFLRLNPLTESHAQALLLQQINTEQSLDQTPRFISRLFHNLPLIYIGSTFKNFIKSFSLDFLFLSGDGNPRHNMMTMGGLYYGQLVLLIAGVYMLYRRQKKALVFLVLLATVAALPNAIIGELHFLRSASLAIPLSIICGFSLVNLFQTPGLSRKIVLLTGLAIIIQMVFALETLYFLAPRQFSDFWSYPARQASEVIEDNKLKYDYIIASSSIDNMQYAYPVYAKLDPQKVIFQNQHPTNLGGNNYQVYGHVYIGPLGSSEFNKLKTKLQGQVLYILPAREALNFSHRQVLQGLDSNPSIVLVKSSDYR